jgi:hypothetical protein
LYVLEFANYRAYLASDLWKSRRARWYRDHPDSACFVCAGATTVLHHFDYRRIGRERDRDLIPLCGGCHLWLHAAVENDGVPLCRAHIELQVRREVSRGEIWTGPKKRKRRRR